MPAELAERSRAEEDGAAAGAQVASTGMHWHWLAYILTAAGLLGVFAYSSRGRRRRVASQPRGSLRRSA
jgi:hypothetical protein